MKKSFLIIISLLLLGCTTREANFTIISTKSYDWTKSHTLKKAGNKVIGEDIAHLIIFIPTGISTINEAVDNALDSVPGAVALVDVVVYSKFMWIPFIYGQEGYIVMGTPLIDSSFVFDNEENNVYRISYFDSKNNMITKEVTEDEFLDIKEGNSIN